MLHSFVALQGCAAVAKQVITLGWNALPAISSPPSLIPAAQYNFLLFTCSFTTRPSVFFYFYGLLVQLFWGLFEALWVFVYISQMVAIPLETFL